MRGGLRSLLGRVRKSVAQRMMGAMMCDGVTAECYFQWVPGLGDLERSGALNLPQNKYSVLGSAGADGRWSGGYR